MEFFVCLPGWQQALIACTFTWAMTAAGASLVFFFKNIGPSAFSFMMSGASGIMLASAFFSLLLPALESGVRFPHLALTAGFVCGGLLIVLADVAVDRLNLFRAAKSRPVAVTCAAVTIHNIPEGMAVGVAFAAAGPGAVAALMLAFGIGVQNFPEGMCVAFPLRANGCSRFKSFFMGQLSGAVEIAAGVSGALAVSFVSGVLPFALSFSAGAMLAVVCSELIPQSFARGKLKAAVGVVAGFALMMALDIALG